MTPPIALLVPALQRVEAFSLESIVEYCWEVSIFVAVTDRNPSRPYLGSFGKVIRFTGRVPESLVVVIKTRGRVQRLHDDAQRYGRRRVQGRRDSIGDSVH